jgi:hypothetical protein
MRGSIAVRNDAKMRIGFGAATRKRLRVSATLDDRLRLASLHIRLATTLGPFATLNASCGSQRNRTVPATHF